MSYSIVIHTLGWADIAEREPYQYVSRGSISELRLAYNLANLWAPVAPVSSDGPAVAIEWRTENV